MALATDYVFRPREAPAPEAGGRRSTTSGNGEEFSELLSKARDSQAEPLGTGPQELALGPAAPPPLPAGAGLVTLPQFSQDGLLSASAASEPVLAVPAADIAETTLPGIASGEVVADTKLVAASQADPREVDPRSLKPSRTVAQDELSVARPPTVQVAPEPADPNALPEEAHKIMGDPDRIVPQTPAEVVLQAASGGLATDRNAGSSSEATPQFAEPAFAKPENPESTGEGTVPAADVSKPLALPTATTPRTDAAASAGSSAPAKEIAAPAAGSRAGTATRTEKDAHRSFESGAHSEPATLTTTPTASFGVAAAALDVQTVSLPVAGAVPAVAASSSAINSRNIAKPDSGQGSDIPSSVSSLPAPDNVEFKDMLGTGDRLATSETPGSSTQGPPALAAVASAPAAIQSSSISVAVPAAMSPANAVLVASPADITSIVSNAVDNGDADRIVIQLDPPELGRVSIDFKFDANGLQHVTVTGESPEAMRQLRLMHFELTQALERHGITSQNMSFQQQQQNPQQSPTPNPFARQGILNEAGTATTLDPMIALNTQTSPRTPTGGRLDMKL